jgi:hypothetical protein
VYQLRGDASECDGLALRPVAGAEAPAPVAGFFSQRFLRSYPSAGFHWKLEFQARGAAHFHPIFWNLNSDERFVSEFRIWLSWNWFEVVNSGDQKHLSAGTSADPIKSQFGIMRYVSGYASKSDQTKPGCKVGRYWGIVGRANIPWVKEQIRELSSAQAKLVRRTARRYMQAMNRVRRIRRLEALLPRQLYPEFMLSGDLRRFRKRCPDAKIFQQLPRKLRLKNNRNVNVFCNAMFWYGAFYASAVGSGPVK